MNGTRIPPGIPILLNAAGLAMVAREAGLEEILEYGDFAVPQLVNALDGKQSTRELAVEALKKITDQNMDDPEKWEQWYEQHKHDY